jgi:hypothetical protein
MQPKNHDIESETEQQVVSKATAAINIFRNSTGKPGGVTDAVFANEQGLLDIDGVANALPYLLVLESVLAEDPTYASMDATAWRDALLEGAQLVATLPIMGAHQAQFQSDGRFTATGYAACALGWRMANTVSQRDWRRDGGMVTPWPGPRAAMKIAVDDYLQQLVVYGRVPGGDVDDYAKYVGWAPSSPEQVALVFSSNQYLLAALDQCPLPQLCTLAHPKLGGVLEMLYTLESSKHARRELMASLWPAIRDDSGLEMPLPGTHCPR